jgi:ABC-type Fe3+ transport system permease subunit
VLSRDGKLIGAVALALFYLPGVIAGVIQPDTEGVPASNAALVTMLVIAIIGLVGQLAIIRLALGNHGTVGEAIRHGGARTPAYLASGLIWVFPFAVLFYTVSRGLLDKPPHVSPGQSLGTLLLLIALIFLSVRLMMSSAVASSEQAGPVGIIRRSWELTRGHWWRLFAFLVAFLFVAIVALSAVGAIAGIVGTLLFGEAHAMTVSALFNSLLVELVTTLVTVGFLVMLARIYAQLALPAASVPSSGT